MLAIAYSGSFVLMEETSEKTEKTENSEEALHSTYWASGLQRTIVKKRREVDASSLTQKDSYHTKDVCYAEQSNFNITHIYLSSYLRFHV